MITVAITDWLRDRRMVETIRSEIAGTRDHATQKLDTVRNVLRLLREKKQVQPGEILKFDVAIVREMKGRVLHLLDPGQRLALDAVLFRMEGVDTLLSEVHQQQENLRPLPGGATLAGRDELVRQLDARLDATIVNLKMLVEMADRYVAGDFAAVTQRRYLLSDYAEPPAEQLKNS